MTMAMATAMSMARAMADYDYEPQSKNTPKTNKALSERPEAGISVKL